jgi:hypothetical protein
MRFANHETQSRKVRRFLVSGQRGEIQYSLPHREQIKAALAGRSYAATLIDRMLTVLKLSAVPRQVPCAKNGISPAFEFETRKVC